MTTDPRYPIGRFAPKDSYSSDDIRQSIAIIRALPDKLEAAVRSLPAGKVDQPYRDGGWTRRAVIHHVADSHMNAYIRTKWTLTEETPLIKAYDENTWVTTPEIHSDVNLSVNLLRALHTKWVALLQQLPAEAFQRSFTHPQTGANVSLARMVALYAWHGDHHVGHLLLP